ncbi:MAG: DUF86 domain-containing protein [Deltaproteobacteria bacterium]|nr:DUF86 domain-containing protein [Deltaproteobacteria bacterium]
MVRTETVRRKCAKAAHRLDAAEQIFARPANEFLADSAARDLASFYLFLAVQECIDVAIHWIADSGWAAPADAGSTFDVLAGHGVIDQTLADEMRGLVRVRNLIARGYDSIDPNQMQDQAKSWVDSLRRMIQACLR